MKSSELLPFSRNRYYKGKMLTSSDFEAEQVYMNHKRRFVNQMVAGSGIVCGLGVISLDDLSLMIESGMAIDDVGREIVVDSSIVKKLSTINGFESLKSNQVSLCLRYREEDTQPVYAVNRQDGEKEYEYNRIEEGFELFLQDSDSLSQGLETETEFFTGGVLFENQDYVVRLKLPVNLCAGHYVKLVVEAEKCSETNANLSYRGVLQTPPMTSLKGAQELLLTLENVNLKCGGKLTKEYWMLVQEETLADSSVMLKPGSTKVTVGGVEIPAMESLNCKVNVTWDEPQLLAAREAGKISLELRNMGAGCKTTVYGNADLFDTNGAVVSAETAVKVMNDKGSFMVAVRLMQDVDYLLLTYRWIAIRVNGEEPEQSLEPEEPDKSISAVTPTVVLGTKETYFF